MSEKYRLHFCPHCGSKGPVVMEDKAAVFNGWRVVESTNPNGTHNHRCGTCGNPFTH